MIVMCASRDVCTLGSEGFTCVACMDWVATSGRSSVCVTPSSCSLPAGRGQCFFQFPFSRSLGSLCKRMGPWQPRQDGDEEKGSVVEKEDGQNHTGTDTKVLVYIYIYIYILYIVSNLVISYPLFHSLSWLAASQNGIFLRCVIFGGFSSFVVVFGPGTSFEWFRDGLGTISEVILHL